MKLILSLLKLINIMIYIHITIHRIMVTCIWPIWRRWSQKATSSYPRGPPYLWRLLICKWIYFFQKQKKKERKKRVGRGSIRAKLNCNFLRIASLLFYQNIFLTAGFSIWWINHSITLLLCILATWVRMWMSLPEVCSDWILC